MSQLNVFALCMSCCTRTHADMLTGYCIMGERCDGCRTVTDLALSKVKEEYVS